MKNNRILWISNSPGAPTGNGKITREFIKRVHNNKDYSVAVLGRGYIGWPGDRKEYECTLYPMNIGRPYPDILKEISREFKPHVVISCLDMWQIDWIEHAKHSEAVTNIGYISIYGKPVPYEWKKVVKNLDLAVCYSVFGKNVLKEFMPFSSIEMIHLGVDTNLYRPLADREALKKKHKLDGRFVIGCIARNQLRKRLDKLLEGFQKFHKKHRNAVLYLKTEAVSDHGYNLHDLIGYYGIRENVYIDESKSKRGYSEKKIVELLNTFDVYVQTSGAEGFGLPLLEAMACGVPVIAPDYSSCSELVKDHGVLLSPHFSRIIDMASVEQVSIDSDELADKLLELCNDRRQREELQRKGREFARHLTWDVFASRWRDILSNVSWERV